MPARELLAKISVLTQNYDVSWFRKLYSLLPFLQCFFLLEILTNQSLGYLLSYSLFSFKRETATLKCYEFSTLKRLQSKMFRWLMIAVLQPLLDVKADHGLPY